MQRSVKYFAELGTVAGLILFPQFALAACSNYGYTVVFINGIRDSENVAQTDANDLWFQLGSYIDGQPLTVKLAYNGSHLAGAGDFIETRFPKADDTDLRTILMQMHDQVQTRKILLVGHSQGAVYANKVYEYLVQHGEPAASVGVYAIATPDSYVAGDGRYLTYGFDDDITIWANVAGLSPLPANVQFNDVESSAQVSSTTVHGHNFIDTYLNFFPNRITSDINTELWLLRSEPSAITDGCFDSPSPDPLYSMQKGALASGDLLATGLYKGYQGAVAVLGTAGNMLAAVGSFVGSVADFFHPNGPIINGQAATDAVMAGLSSLNFTTITPKVNEQLKSGDIQDLGAAAVLAVLPDDTKKSDTLPQGEVLGAATGTPQDIATTTVIESPLPPELSVPIPQPNPTAGFVGSSDSQGGSSAHPAPAAGGGIDNSASSSTPPVTLTPPQNIVFSNWRSPDGNSYCDVISRTVDVSWDPVPGATSYTVWKVDSTSDQPVVTISSASATNLPLSFGLNWSNDVTIRVVATDGMGDYATTSVSAGDAADKVAPIVVSLNPVAGATDVSITTPLQIVYSKTLDSSTVLSPYIALAHIFTPEPVSGPLWEDVPVSVSLEGDGHTVDVMPNSALLHGEKYSLAASCAVKDLHGNHAGALISPTNSPQFTTATST